MIKVIFKIIIFFKIIYNSILGMRTNGVRALILNDKNEILLVFHTYIPGWHFPGGGVDKGESPRQAIIREVHEEAGIIVKEEPTLYECYHHKYAGAEDIICMYIIKKFESQSFQSPEIKEAKWFSLDKLPHDISKASKRRIGEYFFKQEKSENW